MNENQKKNKNFVIELNNMTNADLQNKFGIDSIQEQELFGDIIDGLVVKLIYIFI